MKSNARKTKKFERPTIDRLLLGLTNKSEKTTHKAREKDKVSIKNKIIVVNFPKKNYKERKTSAKKNIKSLIIYLCFDFRKKLERALCPSLKWGKTYKYA
jgi:hypothetical protein